IFCKYYTTCNDTQHMLYFFKSNVLEKLNAVYLFKVPERSVVVLSQISRRFIRLHLSTGEPDSGDVETLCLELTELQQKYDALLEENRDLKNRVKLIYTLDNFKQTPKKDFKRLSSDSHSHLKTNATFTLAG
uniref:Uncharacterized protein n=1 Tax=Astyanax mexicanus TaxID=7994 RepID=A0A8B9JZ98_ASTMX